MTATATTNARPSSLRGSCSGKARTQNGWPSMAAVGSARPAGTRAAAAGGGGGGGRSSCSPVRCSENKGGHCAARAALRRPEACEQTPRQTSGPQAGGIALTALRSQELIGTLAVVLWKGLEPMRRRVEPMRRALLCCLGQLSVCALPAHALIVAALGAPAALGLAIKACATALPTQALGAL